MTAAMSSKADRAFTRMILFFGSPQAAPNVEQASGLGWFPGPGFSPGAAGCQGGDPRGSRTRRRVGSGRKKAMNWLIVTVFSLLKVTGRTRLAPEVKE